MRAAGTRLNDADLVVLTAAKMGGVRIVSVRTKNSGDQFQYKLGDRRVDRSIRRLWEQHELSIGWNNFRPAFCFPGDPGWGVAMSTNQWISFNEFATIDLNDLTKGQRLK